MTSPISHTPPPPPDAALRSVHTSNLPALFERLQISLVVSTYQAGKVIVVRTDGGVLNTHFRTFAKPMGIAADHARLTIGGTLTIQNSTLSGNSASYAGGGVRNYGTLTIQNSTLSGN